MHEEKKTDAAETLWLYYFNHYLFEHGLISEDQRNRMTFRIQIRGPFSSRRRTG